MESDLVRRRLSLSCNTITLKTHDRNVDLSVLGYDEPLSRHLPVSGAQPRSEGETAESLTFANHLHRRCHQTLKFLMFNLVKIFHIVDVFLADLFAWSVGLKQIINI